MKRPAMLAGLLFTGIFALVPTAHARQATTPGGGPAADQESRPLFPLRGPYDFVTNTRSEVVNFQPEPFTGITTDSDGKAWVINPYASTLLCFTGFTTTPDLLAPTGLNPVSVAVWEPGPLPSDRKILVACQGTHAVFLHDSETGDVDDVQKVDSEPGELVIDPDNQWAFVACRGSNTVLKLDLPSLDVLDSYELPMGQRPGPLYLDRGDEGEPGDNRVYVAAMVTGNNSIPLGPGPNTVGVVFDLDGFAGGELPDEDVFRIDPFTDEVDGVIRGAGSLLFDLGRNPATGEMWVLSSDSRNKDPNLQSEPLVRGQFVVNQLVTVPGVDNRSGLIQAPLGIDLDDHDPVTDGPQYDNLLSINQARSMDFLTDASGALSGFAFIASPKSDVILAVDSAGGRVLEFLLPPNAQCYDIDVYDAAETLFTALCLGTMTIEVFSWNPFVAHSIASFPIGLDPTPDQIRRGRDVFLDGQRSADGRLSCGGCHPGGASDQLGWSLRGDPCDQKDVMVTQSLLSIADSFPHHWRGERDLEDFHKAFQGLLGTPVAEDPTPEEMQDFIVFMQTLQAPANPCQNTLRVLDDAATPEVMPNGHVGSAVLGQQSFQSIPNFNGNTCAECHTFGSGTAGNFFAEVGSGAPRAAGLESAHLRQLQHKGNKTTQVDFGGPNGPLTFNEEGFGILHNGGVPTAFNFIFDTPVFFSLTDLQRTDVVKFVKQWDQGISPASHYATYFDQANGAAVANDIETILLNGAENGWNDVVVFGEYDSGNGLEPMRWWYNPHAQVFEPEVTTLAGITWPHLLEKTLLGEAQNVVVGLPPGNGIRFGLDHDNDGLINGREAALGTDPWDPDTDMDGHADGAEVDAGEDPLVPQAGLGDSDPPTLVGMPVLDHTTARVAKYHVRFSEPVKYMVRYSTPGGPERQFERDYFTSDDTFVLTHEEPSTPTVAPITFDVAIEMTDRAGLVTGPIALTGFQPLEASFMLGGFPLFTHVSSMEWTKDDRSGDMLDAEVKIKIDFNYLAPDYLPAEGMMVFSIVSLHQADTNTFEQSDTFTTSLPTSFEVVSFDGLELAEYDEDPGGPWIVSGLTDANGETTIDFKQGGLAAGQIVKVSVMGIVAPTDPPKGTTPADTVYSALSLFQMTPLLLEDAAELKLDF